MRFPIDFLQDLWYNDKRMVIQNIQLYDTKGGVEVSRSFKK